MYGFVVILLTLVPSFSSLVYGYVLRAEALLKQDMHLCYFEDDSY